MKVTLLLLLLALLTASEGDSISVEGRTGQNVTLPCTYDIKYHGPEFACWGRGQIPSRGCNNQLIYTDGSKVLTRASSRYQLLGRLDEGDVSLTILNLTEEDAGLYGCRVEIPGWFNDQKYHIDLTVTAAPNSTPTASNTETPTEPTTSTTELTAATQSSGHMTFTETHQRIPFSTNEGGNQVVVLVCVLLSLVFLLTVGGLFFMVRRQKRLNKLPQQQQVGSSVQFSASSSTLQLHSRGSAVENIYTIEVGNSSNTDGGGGNTGEYEYCP